jgi:hypothetical protein
VPFISFPIGLGVAGMVGIDLLGLIRGWRSVISGAINESQLTSIGCLTMWPIFPERCSVSFTINTVDRLGLGLDD